MAPLDHAVRCRRSRSGFTLIELMLAIGIAVLLVVLLFSLYRSLVRTVDDQHARRQGGVALAQAIHEVGRDLTSSVAVPGHESAAFRLSTGTQPGGEAATLSFATTRYREAPDGSADLRWFDIVEVEYRLETRPQTRGRLIRSERSLFGPEALQPARNETLVNGIAHFSVRILVEDEWLDEWTQEMEDDTWPEVWPQAARIELRGDDQVRGTREQVLKVLIPVGIEVKSPDPAE